MPAAKLLMDTASWAYLIGTIMQKSAGKFSFPGINERLTDSPASLSTGILPHTSAFWNLIESNWVITTRLQQCFDMLPQMTVFIFNILSHRSISHFTVVLICLDWIFFDSKQSLYLFSDRLFQQGWASNVKKNSCICVYPARFPGMEMTTPVDFIFTPATRCLSTTENYIHPGSTVSL